MRDAGLVTNILKNEISFPRRAIDYIGFSLERQIEYDATGRAARNELILTVKDNHKHRLESLTKKLRENKELATFRSILWLMNWVSIYTPLL
jgi:hypothetical protein